ncbi:uncharacterized protein LOC125947112 [Dermacentor silvarum]|uniref:uncharacterized protein LOC125947112 n=1 Tax=Dermacentor silvarum TaxID=543639 RepID=UPI00210085E4|nr:uncharacterized protein LOC125947112 [Dermacentor silvarum]
MARVLRFAIVALALITAAELCNGSEDTNTAESADTGATNTFYQLWSNNTAMWYYNTTANMSPPCLLEVRNYINETMVNLTDLIRDPRHLRPYTDPEVWQFSTRNLSLMWMTHGMRNQTEELLYSNENKSCGVVKYEYDICYDVVHYHLLVGTEDPDGAAKNCQPKYANYTQYSKKVYRNWCKKYFQAANDAQMIS